MAHSKAYKGNYRIQQHLDNRYNNRLIYTLILKILKAKAYRARIDLVFNRPIISKHLLRTNIYKVKNKQYNIIL